MILKNLKLIILSLLLGFLNSNAQTSHYVTTGEDDGTGSFRNLLSISNHSDTIKFAAEIDTVFLTTAELILDKSLVIQGNPDTTVIFRSDKVSGEFRIFRISSNDSLKIQIELLEIANGKAPAGTTESLDGENGGGILIEESHHFLEMKDCVIIGNEAGDGIGIDWEGGGDGGNGGGIYSLSRVDIDRCRILNNNSGSGAIWRSGNIGFYNLVAGDGGTGGGIYISNKLFIGNSELMYNQARDGRNAYGIMYEVASASGGNGGSGGGLYHKNDSLIIDQCIFWNNKAGDGGGAQCLYDSYAGVGGSGGGVYLKNAMVVINTSEFSGNSAGDGGVALGDPAGAGRDGGHGGGIYGSVQTIDISDTEIRSNRSGTGGYVSWNSGNMGSGGDGGGAYISGFRISLSGCIIEENIAGNGAFVGSGELFSGANGGSGGGLFLAGGNYSMSLEQCMIRNNQAGDGGEHSYCAYYKGGGNGGHGGGVYIKNSIIKPSFINCEISSCRSGSSYDYSQIHHWDWTYPGSGNGGGLALTGTSASLINVTVAENKTGTSFLDGEPVMESDSLFEKTRGKGSGLYSSSKNTDVINSLFAYNRLSDSIRGGEIEGDSLKVDYSFISDSSGCDLRGENNIFNLNPYFASIPDSLMLTPSSWAINNGTPDTNGLAIPDTDLAGNSRIFGDIIDMGAYEYQGVTYQELSISNESVIFDDIIPGGESRDTIRIENTGLQAILIDPIFICCEQPFEIWNSSDSNWSNSLSGFILAGNGDMIEFPLRFVTDFIGFHEDTLRIISSAGIINVMLEGECVEDSGVEELSLSNLIYPNPCKGIFWMKLTDISGIQILNSSGQSIFFNTQKTSQGLKIEIPGASNGIYTVLGNTGGRQFGVKVLVLD